jgi:hypothetical protein
VKARRFDPYFHQGSTNIVTEIDGKASGNLDAYFDKCGTFSRPGFQTDGLYPNPN